MSNRFDILREYPAVVHAWMLKGSGGGQTRSRHILGDPDNGYPSSNNPADRAIDICRVSDSLGRLYYQLKIGERVLITPLTVQKWELRDTEKEIIVPGRFGRIKKDTTVVKEPVSIGFQPEDLGAVMGISDPRPAVILGYSTIQALGPEFRDKGFNTATRDIRNRSGAAFQAASILPMPLATELFEAMRTEPRSCREFAKIIVRDCVELTTSELGTGEDGGNSDSTYHTRFWGMPNYELADQFVRYVHFATSPSQGPDERTILPLV